ncbi:hypothetical protein BUALT_Bualt12G0024300 [Buddleja alternifolia]|uniref:X8 domain-containing protein n=1 Tax=Buddleja alternifolia TaxID=168488 RepID=A0AAV6WYP0_9LAMI|nr:hypothetical protein BUALT_Bualt12G0024300 [Buddleja alternifolia]
MASTMILLSYLLIVLFRNDGVEAIIGINWGRTSAQRIVPSQVVDLLLQNGVSAARIYATQPDIISAFRGSGIDLTVSSFNTLGLDSLDAAKFWVQNNIVPFADTIRNIYVGSYVWAENKHPVFDSAMNIHNALQDFGLSKIKLNMPLPHLMLKKNLTRPSDGEFVDEFKEVFGRLFRYLEENNTPLVMEMVPITFIHLNNYDVSFGLADNKSTNVITDINGFVYANVIEFLYDSFVWALKKAGHPNLKLVIGQVGWPTDGYPGANISMAERFYKTLLPFVMSNKGTPMRPGAPIDIYLSSLQDENKVMFNYPYSRHWGIYRGNGEPKFKIDLSGQGRDIFPTRTKGIMRMPDRWCVFNGLEKNRLDVMKQFEKACNQSDCTSLYTGGSCSHLDFAGNVSYAFNMFFQFNFQGEEACYFEGMGRVVTTNPSSGSCLFRVDVVRGEQTQYLPTALRSNACGRSNGKCPGSSADENTELSNKYHIGSTCKLHEVPKCAILLFMISTFLALL